MSLLPPTPPSQPHVRRHRQPPATPLPDFRHVFLEPVYDDEADPGCEDGAEDLRAPGAG